MAAKHSAVKRAIQKAMSDRGWLVVPYPAGAYTGPHIHDILACCEGRFFTVEVKTTEDVLSGPRWAGQLRFADKVRRAGGVPIIPVYSVVEAIAAIEKELLTHPSILN